MTIVPRMHPEPRIVNVGSRELAVEDAGPGSGFPILMMNGAGSRHLFPPAVREGQEQGFRLIGYDRPGCGGSTSLPGRRIADCAEDMRAIMSELGISRAAVWGSSGGGPYALAGAAKLPEIVAAACVFASIGPYGEPGLDWAEGLGGDDRREEIRKFFEEPERARAEFRRNQRSPSRRGARLTGGCDDGASEPSRMPRTAGSGPNTSRSATATCCTLVTKARSTTMVPGRTTAPSITPGSSISLMFGLRSACGTA